MTKRGRKRQEGVKRTASGRKSRAQGAYIDDEQGIRIRMRRYGLNYRDAKDHKAATVHGVMFLQKKLSIDQYDAGEEMRRLHTSYLKAIGAKDALASREKAGSGYIDPEVQAERHQRLMERHDRAMQAVHLAQGDNRHQNLHAALDYMLYRNEWHQNLEPDLSTVLKALAVHFGLTVRAKSVNKGRNSQDEKCAG